MSDRASPAHPSLDQFQQYAVGLLGQGERTFVEDHLLNCPACNAQLLETPADDAFLSRLRNAGPVVCRTLDATVETAQVAKRPRGYSCADASATPALPENDEGSLDCLQPPQRDGCLGRLDQYDVQSVIGKGGMGIVLKAVDTVLGRTVAIKVLHPELAANATARKRFVREAQAAAAVCHEHVVTLYAVEPNSSIPYLVMQYVHGVSLQERLDASGPLELKEILRIGLQTAEGLEAAHKQGLVHRDIKPANILLENGVERVKITDFGLARGVNDLNLTQAGFIAGTPHYMSPEQADGRAVDHRSDLFSLGSVLYLLSTGQKPFRGDSLTGVLHQVGVETPPPLRELNPDLPDWLEQIVARLHAKNPAERFQSAQEVADLLGQFLAHVQQPSSPRPTLPWATSSRPRMPQRRLLAAGGFLLLALLVLVVWWQWPKEVPRDPDQTQQRPPHFPPRELPTPETLAARPSPCDKLNRADIPQELLARAGGGNPDRAPPQLVAVLAGHRGQLISVSISPDGKRLASAGNDMVVKLWDLGTGQLQKSLPVMAAYTQLRSLCFSPDGTTLAVARADAVISLWNVATGEEAGQLRGHFHKVTRVIFSPDGADLISASEDGTVKWWDWKKKVARTTAQVGQPLISLALHPDGQTVACAPLSTKGTITLCASGRTLGELPGHPTNVLDLAFHPAGQTLTSAGQDATLRHWALTRLAEQAVLQGHGRDGAAGLAWRPDGRLLVSAGLRDHTIRLWDIAEQPARCDVIQTYFPTPEDQLHGLAMTPEGRHLATANPDGSIYILRLAERGVVYRVKGVQ